LRPTQYDIWNIDKFDIVASYVVSLIMF
jgi:hypothetical protein